MPATRSALCSIASLFLLGTFCTSLGAIAADTKRVLLLDSFGREFPPYDVIVAAFRSELAKAPGGPVAVYDASMAAGQPSGSGDEESLLDLLRHRFAGSAPDVVITIGPPAAAFYTKYREQIFPQVPLVLSGIDERFVRNSALHGGDAAVASHQSLTGVVHDMLRVLPDTKRVVVILGDTPLERYWRVAAGNELGRLTNEVNIEWLNQLSLEQMRRRVATLPPHSAVLYTLLLTDAAGVPYERGTALSTLAAVSAVPLFSLYEHEVEHGVVGSSGSYRVQQREGALAAEAVLRSLSGVQFAEPTIRVVDYDGWVYDWRELRRWGIDLGHLPPGSEVRFRPVPFWDEHRALVISAASILLLQTALLIGLLSQRVRRRRAEQEAMALSGRLITAHEDERRWLARELHDDITQRLAVLAIDAARMAEDRPSLEGAESRHSIRAGLVQLSEDVHDLSYRLHPSVLDDLGLIEALKAECDRIARSEALRVDIQAAPLPADLPRDAALCTYRVAQEALRNIVRHAHASTVHLSLALKEGGLLLTIGDNGGGYDPDSTPARHSLGHASMRERLRLLGGQLQIASTPGRGTTVIAWVPIPKVPY